LVRGILTHPNLPADRKPARSAASARRDRIVL